MRHPTGNMPVFAAVGGQPWTASRNWWPSMHHAGYGRSVGVIAAAAHRHAVAEAFRRADVDFVDAADGQLGGSINVVSPPDAKGLEFDAVVMVEPEAIVAEEDGGERMLYVALTRTIKYLTVIHAGAALPLEEPRPASPVARRGRRRRSTGPADRPRPNRLVAAVAKELADQVQESLADDS
jgi:superfamily I DNA/RNA helicase